MFHMEIEFADKKLQKMCEDEKFANKKIGSVCLKKLKTRISDILAAESVSELNAGEPHPLSRKREGQYAITICGGLRLIFVPANNPTPLNESNNIDWQNVTKIIIIEIVDYHD